MSNEDKSDFNCKANSKMDLNEHVPRVDNFCWIEKLKFFGQMFTHRARFVIKK